VLATMVRKSDARSVRRAIDQIGSTTFLGSILLE
jgi:hypothetical protein